MQRFLSLFALVLFTACGLAENEQDQRNKYIYLTFSDAAFETYCLGAFDSDHDGRISRYEAQRVREIACPGLKIESLSNISEFTNLERLDCAGNRLTWLDVRKCPSLRFLDCSRNRISDLDVRDLGGLTTLYCTDNLLSEINLSTNTSLSALDGRSNDLRILDLSRCARTMTQADLRNNPLLATLYLSVGQNVAWQVDGATEVVVR